MAERLAFGSEASRHVQAYLDYVNTVGYDDGGQMMSEKEYEQFKKNNQKKQKFRIYATWQNSKGLDCKVIGPDTRCFCDHGFQNHEYLDPKDKNKIFCKVPKCSCQCYSYLPVHGSADLKCLCRQSYTNHDPATQKCTQSGCTRFTTSFSCSCGQKYGEHINLFEDRNDRIQRGKPVDNSGGTMGQLTSFQSLADGAQGYEEYINELSGAPRTNNPKALPGTKGPQMISNGGPPGGEYVPSNLNGSAGNQRSNSQLNGINNQIQQEKQNNYGGGGGEPGPYSNYQYKGEEEYNSDEGEGALEVVSGEVTALQLFNTPHMFTRVKVAPQMITGGKKY